MIIETFKLAKKESDFLKLVVEKMRAEDKEAQHIKIDNSNGTFLPLVAEILLENEKGSYLLSLAHYGELNGDLMRDPEICFIYRAERDAFIPYYFRNDYQGIEDIAFKTACMDGRLLIDSVKNLNVKKHLIRNLTNFCPLWFSNIVEQQNLE